MKNKILNTKEIKKIQKLLLEQFGFQEDFNFVFLLSAKEKLYIVNRDIERLDLDRLRISSLGIYFAKYENNEVRLSMEGSQLVGPKATKNVLEMSSEQVRDYFRGSDIEMDLDKENGTFLILKHGKDFFGCAKYKNKKLLNFLSKMHRTQALIIR